MHEACALVVRQIRARRFDARFDRDAVGAAKRLDRGTRILQTLVALTPRSRIRGGTRSWAKPIRQSSAIGKARRRLSANVLFATQWVGAVACSRATIANETTSRLRDALVGARRKQRRCEDDNRRCEEHRACPMPSMTRAVTIHPSACFHVLEDATTTRPAKSRRRKHVGNARKSIEIVNVVRERGNVREQASADGFILESHFEPHQMQRIEFAHASFVLGRLS
jgi:hypothetical protein